MYVATAHRPVPTCSSSHGSPTSSGSTVWRCRTTSSSRRRRSAATPTATTGDRRSTEPRCGRMSWSRPRPSSPPPAFASSPASTSSPSATRSSSRGPWQRSTRSPPAGSSSASGSAGCGRSSRRWASTARRGSLTDESIELMRKLWQGGLVEHEGPGYPLPPLHFEPDPSRPVRPWSAARAAGRWSGRRGSATATSPCPARPTACSRPRAASRRCASRSAAGNRPSRSTPGPTPTKTIEAYRRLVDAGIDTFYASAIGPAREARPSLERFLDEVAGPLRG